MVARKESWKPTSYSKIKGLCAAMTSAAATKSVLGVETLPHCLPTKTKIPNNAARTTEACAPTKTTNAITPNNTIGKMRKREKPTYTSADVKKETTRVML